MFFISSTTVWKIHYYFRNFNLLKVWISSLMWLQCICVLWCKPASVTNVLSHFRMMQFDVKFSFLSWWWCAWRIKTAVTGIIPNRPGFLVTWQNMRSGLQKLISCVCLFIKLLKSNRFDWDQAIGIHKGNAFVSSCFFSRKSSSFESTHSQFGNLQAMLTSEVLIG